MRGAYDGAVPRMDSGPTDGPPGPELQTVWVTLTAGEAASWDGASRCASGAATHKWRRSVGENQGHRLEYRTQAMSWVGNPQP